MNIEQYILICMAEECSEVSHRISKALRFTLDEIEPGHTLTNGTRIVNEIIDLLSVIDLAVRYGIIVDPFNSLPLKILKQEKIAKFMNYSLELGVLSK